MARALMRCTNCDVTEELSVEPDTTTTTDLCIACRERVEFEEVDA